LDSTKIKFGVQLTCRWLYPFNDSLKTFMLADKLGFDSIWTGDHIAFGPDEKILETWMTLTPIAMKTKRVKIGTAVTDPHRRHPAILAQMGTTLDIFSRGRFILGIGAGEAMNLDPYGIIWDHPLSRMAEAITVIKKLWTMKEVDYYGKFYKIHKAYLEPKPIQKPHPPIWIGGSHSKTLKLVAEVANGWIPGGSSPKIYKEDLNDIEKWAEKTGRSVKEIEPAVLLPTAVAANYDEARKFIELTTKIPLLNNPKLLERMGVKPPTYEFTYSRFTYSSEGIKELIKKAEDIPFEAIKTRSVFGTPGDCIDQLEKYVKSGARHIIVRPQSEQPKIREQFLRSYAEKIIPYFKEL